jgi:hypothetical protein
MKKEGNRFLEEKRSLRVDRDAGKLVSIPDPVLMCSLRAGGLASLARRQGVQQAVPHNAMRLGLPPGRLASTRPSRRPSRPRSERERGGGAVDSICCGIRRCWPGHVAACRNSTRLRKLLLVRPPTRSLARQPLLRALPRSTSCMRSPALLACCPPPALARTIARPPPHAPPLLRHTMYDMFTVLLPSVY